jgi:Flp pilus assembly protein TadG
MDAMMNCRKRISAIQTAARRQDGSSMVEIALLLPAFCMLMFGVFAFSMMMVSYLSATYWLREAARYGGMHSLTSISPASTSNVSNMITSNIFLPSGSSPTISVSYVSYLGAASGNYVGNAVLVTVAWTQTISIPFYSRTLSLQNQTYRMITQ